MPKTASPACEQLLADAKLHDRETAYRGGIVLDQLEADFRGKCYICEDSEPTSIQVEHLEPHRENLELKYRWSNLFWSCGHCNHAKGDRFSPMLDCTDADERVWHVIELGMGDNLKSRVAIAVHPRPGREMQAANTARLLERALNGLENGRPATDLKDREARNLRKRMLRVLNEFLVALRELGRDGIAAAIDDSAAFAGLLRWELRRRDPGLYFELRPQDR